MKMRIINDMFVNEKTAPMWMVEQIKHRFGKNLQGKVVSIPYLPAGAILHGEEYLFLAIKCAAAPADDECAAAIGLNAEQIAAKQIEYRMDSLGINNENDRELYRAGVILGYDKELKPIPGPNWEAYQAAKAETEEEEI